MTDTKILQAILDKTSRIEEKITELEQIANSRFDKVDDRLNKIGLSVARLEDDTPTIEEFEKLDRRVTKLENRIVKN